MSSTSSVASAVTGTSLDLNSIVSQLMTVEQKPLDNLTAQEATVQAKISAYGNIQSALSTLQNDMQTLAKASTWGATTANSSNSGVVSATTTSGAAIAAYSLTVSQLATYNSIASNGAYSSTAATFNTGTLSIAVGSGTAVNININSSNNTLAGIQTAINNSGAGVTASIINDGTNQRLVLTSNTSGTAGALTITSTDSGSGGVNALSDFNTGGTTGTYVSPTTTFNTGTLALTVGTGSPVNINIDSSNNTLSGIMNAINSANAGVTASIATGDGGNQRLVLTPNTAGQAVSLTPTDSGSGGTNALSDLTGGAGMTTTQVAQDAKFNYNGVNITRSSNKVSDLVSNVTFTLAGTGSAAVSVTRDNSAATTAINSFITDYNAVVKQNAQLTAFNTTTNTGSTLTGDYAITTISNQLAGMITSQVAGLKGGISSLADIGISLGTDGTLTLDSTQLSTALNSGDDVAGLFSQTSASSTSGSSTTANSSIAGGSQGIAVQFNNWLTQALGTNGIIQNNVNSFNTQVTNIQDQYTSIQTRLTQVEANYRAQFTSLDTYIATMNQTSIYLTQQLASIANTTSSINS